MKFTDDMSETFQVFVRTEIKHDNNPINIKVEIVILTFTHLQGDLRIYLSQVKSISRILSELRSEQKMLDGRTITKRQGINILHSPSD